MIGEIQKERKHNFERKALSPSQSNYTKKSILNILKHTILKKITVHFVLSKS